MSDAVLQLDFFKRVRAPRAQLMAYRDHGWNARGNEICRFDCPRCGASRWMEWKLADANDGPPCPKCNKGK
ncbi:MAG TPA: hypothetical protein VIF61_00245 [Methylocystis sp.]|jgi:hypothetical protein